MRKVISTAAPHSIVHLYIPVRRDESLIPEGHQNGSSCESTGSQLPVIPSQDETQEDLETIPADVKVNRDDSIGSGIANGDSRTGSFEEGTSTRRVAVSVHDERSLLQSYSLKSTNDLIEVLSSRQDATTTAKTCEHHGGTVTKSTSGDTQTSLGVSSSVSGTETSPAILGASTSSLTSIASSVTTYRQPPKHRRFPGCIDENDLSTPYNHYRCLSPNEHHGMYPRRVRPC